MIVKKKSGKVLVFLSRSDPVFINIDLKYKEVVIIALIDWRKRANPAIGPKAENHFPVLHFKVLLTYENPSLQSNIVDNNKKLWLKKVNDKKGKQNFRIDIAHNSFNVLFLILIAIIINNIEIK